MESFDQKLGRVLQEDINVVPYDPRWPDLFRQEKARLENLFPFPLIRRTEHFGSTAVPGLASKPVVDMLVEVADLAQARFMIAPVLEARGYDYFWRPTAGDDTPPFYAWFIRRDPETLARTHHIHMVEANFREHWDRLLFRDYLISHPVAAREYETLKRRLALEHPHDRIRYTREKSEFISQLTERARRELPLNDREPR